MLRSDTVDETDKKIISILKEDSRTSYTKISKLVNMSIPSVVDRINKLNEKGIIEKYTIELNHKNLGQGILAIICVDVKRSLSTDFFNFCKEKDEVISYYRVVGLYNSVIYVSLENTEKLELFIDKIKNFGSSNTLLITSNFKK